MTLDGPSHSNSIAFSSPEVRGEALEIDRPTRTEAQRAGAGNQMSFVLTGQTCEIDINECVKSPCRHGASCQNTNGSYRCLCQAGYTGRNCESDIDDCRPSKWYPALSILYSGASIPKHTWQGAAESLEWDIVLVPDSHEGLVG